MKYMLSDYKTKFTVCLLVVVCLFAIIKMRSHIFSTKQNFVHVFIILTIPFRRIDVYICLLLFDDN